MFSAVESEYLRGLLNVYKEQGYKYYLAHTITESDNDYDFCVYLSQDKITSSAPNKFNLSDNSIVIYVDSSSRNDNSYNPSTGSRDLLLVARGVIDVNVAEFIYTNSEVSYNLIDNAINPDILISGVNSYDNKLFSYGLMFVVISIFLYMFIKSILRIRK